MSVQLFPREPCCVVAGEEAPSKTDFRKTPITSSSIASFAVAGSLESFEDLSRSEAVIIRSRKRTHTSSWYESTIWNFGSMLDKWQIPLD